jgi:hypothetical protein
MCRRQLRLLGGVPVAVPVAIPVIRKSWISGLGGRVIRSTNLLCVDNVITPLFDAADGRGAGGKGLGWTINGHSTDLVLLCVPRGGPSLFTEEVGVNGFVKGHDEIP